jgi:hypothetical protein
MSELQAGPELDAKLAEAMGWKDVAEEHDGVLFGVAPDEDYSLCTDGCDGHIHGDFLPSYSEDVEAAITAAEELRKAGKIHAWDVHQFETTSASTGRLMPNGRTLAWADAVQGETPAHALTLALLAAVGYP